MCEPLADRPDLIEGLKREIQSDLLGAYKQMENLARQLDHDLREEQQKVILLLRLVEVLHNNCTDQGLVDRADRVLGRTLE